MIHRKRGLTMMFICLTQASWVLAETGDVFQFLKEEARVTTASKREELLQDAPDVITVITADEIKRYGAQNLRDVLLRAPSLYPLSSYLYPSNIVSTRGDLETHVDNHILWLLNGRPLREPAFGGVNIALVTTFPLDMIDHLEIVRGPGSVLYGSNAYEGVINILTKQGQEKEAEVHMDAGSHNTGLGAATAQVPFKEGGLAGSFVYNRSTGWKASAQDEKRVSGSMYAKEEETGVAAAAQYKNWSMSGFYANTHHVAMGVVPQWTSVAPTNTGKGMFDLGYKHPLIENWSLGINETVNRSEIGVIGNAGASSRDGTSFLTEVTLYGQPLRDLNIVLGGTGDYQEAMFDPENVDVNQTWWSFYSQADYRLNSYLKILGGMQYNKPKNVSGEVSPRAGLIANFNSAWGTKILYGEAFRAPYLGETQFNTVNLRSNPNLKPETIKTYEAELFHQSRRVQSGLTFFHSQQDNRIGRQLISGLPTYANRGELTSHGIELEGTANVTPRLSFTGSYSYQENWDQNNVYDATFMPNHMVKTGVSYVASAGVTVSVFNSYFSERGDVIVTNPAALEINPPSSAYHWLTAHVILDLEKLTRSKTFTGLSLRVYGTNLLNEQIFDPEFNRRTLNTLPAAPGRQLFGELRVKFL